MSLYIQETNINIFLDAIIQNRDRLFVEFSKGE